MEIIAKTREFNDGKGLLAFADVTLGGMFVIKGLTIREGQNGMYVSMPSKKLAKPYTDKNGNEKQYEDTFFPITGEARQALIEAVLNDFNSNITEDSSDDLPF